MTNRTARFYDESDRPFRSSPDLSCATWPLSRALQKYEFLCFLIWAWGEPEAPGRLSRALRGPSRGLSIESKNQPVQNQTKTAKRNGEHIQGPCLDLNGLLYQSYFPMFFAVTTSHGTATRGANDAIKYYTLNITSYSTNNTARNICCIKLNCQCKTEVSTQR